MADRECEWRPDGFSYTRWACDITDVMVDIEDADTEPVTEPTELETFIEE